MSPVIPENSFLIFHHFIYRSYLKVGKIVRVNHPTYGSIVKKIIKVDSADIYWLEGLNSSSISCSQMGPISLNMISGINFYKVLA
jgi:hypothetical protein